jgi:muramoyltetrapeptide carboxypeptidase
MFSVSGVSRMRRAPNSTAPDSRRRRFSSFVDPRPGVSAPRIHLLSVAGSDRDLPQQLGLAGFDDLVEMTQDAVGGAFTITATPQLLNAATDDRRGGRSDDQQRAEELTRCFADDAVAALVALRGGAWLTRILPRVDFTALRRRSGPMSLFGFSELTTLVNIAGAFPQVRAFYDLGPAYLRTSLRDHPAVEAEPAPADAQPGDKERALAVRFAAAFREFFTDISHTVATGRSRRILRGELLAGRIADGCEMQIVGGCLSVLVTLCGTPFQRCINAADKWLALEDLREEPYRLDRYLAQLNLSGVLDACAGILLGDFHTTDDSDQTAVMLELLRIHLPAGRDVPIIGRCNFGHCHGVAPVPIHRSLQVRAESAAGRNRVLLEPLS